MPRAGSIKFFVSSVILCLVLTICYLILAGHTFYADLVAGKVRDAIEKTGTLTMSWDALKGNPLTGVYVLNAKISSGDMELASVEEIEMKIALTTAASPEARLSRLTLSGLVTDIDNFSGLSFQQNENSGPSPVENLRLMNSTIYTPWGILNLDRGSIELSDPIYRLDIRGNFADTQFSAEGLANIPKVDNSDSKTLDINDFRVNFGNMSITASGHVMPALEMNGAINDLDIRKLTEFLPFLDKYDMEGFYDASFYATNANPEDISELEISGNLTGHSGKIFGILLDEASAKFHYSNNFFKIREISVKALNGKLSSGVDLKLASGRIPVVAARIQAESIDTIGLIPLLPWTKNFAGTIDAASCDLSGSVNSISANARLTSSFLNVASFSCSDIDANVVMDKDGGIKTDFLGNIQGARARGTGTISTAEGVTISADIEIPNISAASLRSNFPQLTDFKVEGDAAVKLGIRGPASALSYAISISSPVLNLLGEYSISNTSAELIYADGTLNVKSLQAKWQDMPFTAEGSVSIPQGGIPAKLAFNGGFSNLNIAKLSDMANAIKEFNLGGVASGSWSISGDTAKPVSSFDIYFPKFFIYGKHLLSDFRAALDYTSPSVNIKSSEFKLNNSSVTASGAVTLPRNEKPMEYNVKGSFKNLDPAILVSMGVISQDISGNLTGDARVWKTVNDTEPSFRLFLKNSNLNYNDESHLSQLDGAITYSGGGLQFERLRAQLNNGSISLDGTVDNIKNWRAPKSVPLNLKTTVTSADIGRIARIFDPSSKGFQGFAEGSAVIKGNLASPAYTAEGTFRGVRAFGLFLPVINFSDLKGDKDHIDLTKIRAIVGRGHIDASGSVNMAKNWETRIKATGTSVDIRSLTAQLEDDVRREITGTLDFNFEGNGPISNFRGNGRGRVPSLSVFGVKMSDVNADVSIADGLITVEDSSAKLYGGDFSAQMTKDLSRTNWGGYIKVTSADMGPLFSDLAPGSEGAITGKTNFTMQLSGDSKRTSMQDGSGKLEILDGEVSDFEGARAMSNMIGGKPLRFRSALFTFTLDGRTIYIIPGSRISAPQEDPVYKYITLDGSVTTQQEVDLSFMGNVNIGALNALIVGFQGLLAATVEGGGVGDTGSLLKNFLGNTVTGFSKNEFRDVSFHIAGKPGDIQFSNVTVNSPVKIDTLPAALKDPDGYKEDRGVKIKVEIPVGPGSEGNPHDGVKDQLSGQILDQLIKGLIFDGE